MNRIFRIVWNRALGQMIVASELCRSRSKAGRTSGRGSKASRKMGLARLGAGVVLGLAAASAGYAHTITIGYSNSGDYALTFWYGTYHDTHFPEGALMLSGPMGTTTTDFTLFTQTRPDGLVDGDTNFWSDGTSLVGYDTYHSPVLTWQGMEFTGLIPGTYTFTYVPIPVPTQDWHPIDDVILSSSVTVITADLLASVPRIEVGDVIDETSLDPDKPIIFDGGTLQPSTTTTLDQIVSVASGGGTIDTGDGKDLTLTGDIDGRGLLTKTGDGTLTIEGDNTSVGGLAINGGVVSVGSDSALGDPSAELSFDGGTLNTTGDIDNGRDITLNAGGGTFDTDAGTTLTNSGTISGGGDLTKEGDGTLALTGDNTFTGDLNINDGTVQVSSDNNVGTGTVTIGDGTLQATGDFNIDNAVTLTDANSTIDTQDNDATLSGPIDGSGALNKIGDGTLSLGGTNTFSGGLNIDEGTVQVSNADNLGTGMVTVGDATLQATGSFDAGNAFALTDDNSTIDTQGNDVGLTGNIGGSGALNKSGSGTLALSGDNDFSGGLNIDEGTVQVSDADNLGTGTVTIGDGSLQAAGDFDADNAIALTDAHSTVDTQDNQVGLGGDVSGDGTLNKDGTGTLEMTGTLSHTGGTTVNDGTLVLAGDNTYTGGTTVNGGTVEIGSDDNLGDAGNDVTLNGGSLHTTADIDTARDISVGVGNGTIASDDGTTLTSTGAVTGSGALVKDGEGSLVLDGVAAQTGGTTVNDGTLVLNGDNTYSGGTTLNGGTLQVGSDSNLGDASSDLTFNGGTLHTTGDFTTARDIALDAGNGTIASDTGTTLTSTGAVTGSGSLVKDGDGTLVLDGVASQTGGTIVNDGTLVLNGDNTYSGGTTLNGGTLQVGSDSNLGDAGSDLTFNGGTLHTTGDITTARDITLDAGNGTIASDAGTTLTSSGDIGGTGALAKEGDGTLVLGGDNSFSGGLNIDAGTVQASAADNLGSGTITLGDASLQAAGDFTIANTVVLTDADSLVDTQAHDVAISGTVGGTGDLNKAGSGTLTLAGANTYTGATAIDDGTLALSGAGSLASSSHVVNNGTLDISAATAGASVKALTGSGEVQLGDKALTLTNASGDFGGTIAGTGSVVIDHGTQSLSGNNTFSGGLQVNGGTVQASSDANLGGGTVTIGASGTLQSTGSFTSDNAFVLKGAGSTIDTHGSDVVLSGQVSGAGTLNKVGDGTLTLTGNNSQNGIHVKGGTLAFDGDAALGASTGVVTIEDDTTLRSLSDVDITHSIYVNDTRSAVFDTGNHAVTVSGNIDGAGIVQKLGGGVLTLSGNNSQVLMEVKGGSIAVASQAAAGAAGGDIYIGTDGNFTTLFGGKITQKVHVTGDNAHFNTNGHDVTLTGTVDGNACFIKSGEGRLDLRGGGSNAIGACVKQGDLAFNSTFTGKVWVYEGATASGSGRIEGDVDVKGTLSPGNSPGLLQVAGSVKQQGSSRLLVDVDGRTAGIGAGHFDTLELVGAQSVYTAGGTLEPRLRGITGDAGNTFVPEIGDTFRIVHAEGGVEGEYASVMPASDGLPDNARFDVRYTAADVILAVTPDSYSQLLAAYSTSNAASVGAAVDGVRGAAGVRLSSTDQLQDELLGMDADQLSHTFQQLGGEVHADLMNAVMQSGYRLQSTVRQRMASPANGDVAAVDGTQRSELGDHFWTTTIHANGRIDDTSAAQGYGFNNNTLVVGLDNAFSENLTAGGGVAYSRDAVYAGWLGEGKQSSYQAFAYGVWQSGGNYVNGIVGYSNDDYSIDRSVDLSSGAAQLSSDPRGHSVSVDIEAGRRFDAGAWAITPAVGLSSQNVHRDGVQEHGAAQAALDMSSSDIASLRARLGGRISTSFGWRGWEISPHLDVFAVHQMGDTSAVLTSRLSGTGSFRTVASAAGRDGVQVGAGVVANVSSNATLYVDYQSDSWSHATSHEFKAGVRIAF
jgi:autotransporter-associated beta strand protein